MKVLFVMERRAEAGSIQAIANYVRAGDELGHTIAIYGQQDSDFPGVRFSSDVSAFDYVVFIFESNLYWPRSLHLAHILSNIPRERRAILDADGMYNQIIVIDGYDRNYWSEHDRSEWLAHYNGLADKILQPTLGSRLDSQVIAVPFYGYDPASRIGCDGALHKRFDILYVGHNWWRWREVSNNLLPAIEQIRAHVGDICFIGLWWDKVQSWARASQWELAYALDSESFRQLDVQVRGPVPYSQVIATMSEGRVNIMTQRPLLRHLKHLTSKYFEVFCAGTIPLVMLDPDHAEMIYGPAGRELVLHDRIADKLLDALNHPEKYGEIVQEVRRHLVGHHSYHNRVQELVTALRA